MFQNRVTAKRVYVSIFFTALFLLYSNAFTDDYTQWKYWTKVSINTTVITGLTGSVTNFPLLVRLTSTNFDFTQAKAGGADIRFSKSDDGHIPFEIERWDSTNRLAEIWVLVDNVVNNNSTQYVKMYWGNTAAADSSKPAVVFNTTNFFAAVWHLNESPAGGTAGAIKDRTSYGNNGTSGGGMTATDLVDGRIGKGVDFNGGTDTNDYINVGSGASIDTMDITSMSAWIYPRGWGGLNYGRILNKTDAITEGLMFMVSNYGGASGGVSTFVLYRHRSGDTTNVRGADNTVSLNQWNYITGVMNGTTSSKLYINGSEVSSYFLQNIGAGTVTNESAYPMFIGNRQDSARGFNGIMDEISISNNVRSPDWIKLNYETQKSSQTVVGVQKTSMPAFTLQPFSDTVYEGDPVSFTVAVTGTPAPTLQWQKKQGTGAWTNIASTVTTYSIGAAALADAASYRVIATNTNGYAASSEAILLVVTSAPAFLTHPKSDTANVGDTVIFTSSATGQPPITYQWRKKQGAGAWGNILVTTPVCTLRTIAFLDSGFYRVTATNGIGTATSDSAHLRVASDAPRIVTQPRNDTAHVGTTGSFTVVVSGNPLPTTKWQKRNTSGVWDSIAAGTTYTKSNVAMIDTGVYYRAVATNPLGFATSDSVQFIVWDSTINLIITNPKNDTALVNDTARFSVVAQGSSLTYQWDSTSGAQKPQPIAGATGSTYKFITKQIDNGKLYRCRVFSGLNADTSELATLTIGTTPSILSDFPNDTVLKMGKSLSLKGNASAIPSPTYKWCFIYKNTLDSTTIGTGQNLLITSLAKKDSGTYYFMARNRFATKNSDSITVHVLNGLTLIPPDLPSDYFVLNQGEMALTFNVSGDGKIRYQWYWKGAAMIGDTNKTLRINPVDSAKYHTTTFYCRAINSFLGTDVDTLQSNITTLRISKFTNPFKVSVERVDIHNTTQVRVKLWSDVDISAFPSTLQPLNPWADSIWLIYKTNAFPVSEAGANVHRFLIDRIKSAPSKEITDTVTVGEVPLPSDSHFWFSYSVNWHRPAVGVDSLLKPLTNANKVFMLDTSAPPNPLVLKGEYKMKTDTVRIIIDSIDKIDSVNYAFLVVQCSKDSGYQSIVFTDTVLASVLVKSGVTDTIIWDKIGTLPLEKDTIYCRWFLKAKQSAALTQKRTTSFTIGWDRPVYPGTLKADSTFMGDRMHLEWSAVPPGTDSIRIWWNLSKIPLHYEPGLPPDHVHGVKSVAMNRDTIKGFTNNTVYYFGLQILNDDMWSFITLNSSDSEKTAMGDTFQIPNIIYIDSSRFDTVTNSMMIYWQIDKSAIPSGKTCESSFTYTLNSILDTNPPNKWDSVAQSTNETVIPLYSDIIRFDTSYTVGLWLRGVSPAPLGPGKPSRPKKDSSIISVTIPSFTWQEVRFFQTDTDTIVYAANRKIILKKTITNPKEVDTCIAFKNFTLPRGFFAVGGVGFEFKQKLVNIAPFKLGLKHGALPTGVKQTDIGFYRIIKSINSDEFHVIHRFDASTITADSTVWFTVKPTPPDYDLKYPYIILADTLKPKIIVAGYSDTVPTGSDIFTTFAVSDNVANTSWGLKYGRGDQGYVWGDEGYLTKSFDSASALTKSINSTSISESYGVRAIIVTSDGIHRDTVNVSRQVVINNGEVFSVPAKEWVPLRTTAHLNTPRLDSIFYKSTTMPDPWTYDIYDYRIYRWHNPSYADSNYWLEYSEAVNSEFDFLPGRVIWCMTAEDENISYGPGVTTSLRTPYEIELKPRNWTDFSVPFQFPILLREVLEATAPYYDSLVICKWIKQNNTYDADYIFKYTDSIAIIKDTLTPKQKYDGYTVYNHYSTPVKLVIPPTCLALSYGIDNNSITKKRSTENWDVDLRWRNTSSGEQYFKRVICGYKNCEGEDVYGPLPPTMSKVRVGINGNDKTYGWALKRGLDKDGGVTYQISFSNSTGNDATVEYYLDERGGLPPEIKARVYDTKGGWQRDIQGNAVSTVAVDAGSRTTRILAVGPESYFERIFAGFLPMKLLKAFPNPFRGQVRIQYRIPYGMREVTFTLYNVQGRMLWHGVERNAGDAGEHIYTMGLGKNMLPAGVYILRLSAKDERGKTVYGGEKRITCIK